MTDSLEQILSEVQQCHGCVLCEKRKQVVFGVGNPQAEIMLIGEAPGATEDEQGIPFVGRAGQFLDDMLAKGDVWFATGAEIADWWRSQY